jgi:hypothetical protein
MKFPILLLSHVALGLAGWWMAREFQAPSAPESVENARTRSTRQRPQERPGAKLLRSIETRLEKEKSEKARLAAEPGAREKILAALTGLALPADPAAAIEALLAGDDEATSIRAAAHFVLWAKSDPAAALHFASDRERFNRMSCGDEALEWVGEFIAPEMVLAMPKDNRRDPLFSGLARQLISSRTIEELTACMSGLEQELKSTLSFHIGEQWPAERLDDFGRLATAMRDPQMLDRISDKLPPEEMARWLKRYIDEHPDPDFARSVTQTGALFFLLRKLPGMPLEDRLAEVMKRPAFEHQPTESARKEALKHLAENDVSDFFHGDGPDLRYAFHHGKIEAPELLEKLSSRFPEYAAAGLLPALLHQQLTSEDPDRAAQLIADLPDTEKARVIVESAWSISSLDTLNRVLSHFPDSDEEEILASRQKFWKAVTDDGLEHYGKDYLHWISNTLQPLDRKLALGVISDEIDNNNNDEYVAELREIVGDIPLLDPP